MKQLMELLAIPLGNQRTVAKWLVIATPLVELLVKQLAIPLSNQKTVAKWLVIAIPLGCQKALHSHSAKSPSEVRRDGRLYAQLAKYGDISRWLTATKWLVISNQNTVAKSLVIESRR